MKGNILFLLVLMFLFTGCSFFFDSSQEPKSPCADNNGPCKHIPVNNWWLPENLQFNPAYAA